MILPTAELLDRIPTPVYFYDLDLLEATLKALTEAAGTDQRFRVHYAIKANPRPQLLDIIKSYGLGADCVSGNEVTAAIEAGFEPGKIFFAGVGKTDEEILTALHAGIGCFNVESEQELYVIDDFAREEMMTANIALRVNPEIDAHTHRYITTGLSENKFGIPMSQLDRIVGIALRLKGCRLMGLHFHIGSQIRNFDSFKLLCERINALTSHFDRKGIHFSSINVGGGLGIDYDNPDSEPIPPFSDYFRIFRENLNLAADQTLHFELGRSVTGQCAALISKVLYIKEGDTRRFAIIDAGMTDLIRPALYQATHTIVAIDKPADAPVMKYDVVGPVCESSDVFATDVALPELRRGDYVAIMSAGAYGEAMASRYNLRDLPEAVFSI
ncbi:MAG: diaminopimelate decarboxylase [Muribaculaceae bacterium]|nr:diaminopimelate decarboxylase [Muribaculaceae bacterium]